MTRLPLLILLACFASSVLGQRITTIQLDGVQYFISRMNPYSPELNYFLAYQYCRSIGLQLASFETKEKSDSIMDYLRNAGYDKYDFWTSGNRLGADMLIWMSTGLPFNATFDYMKKLPGDDSFPSARQLGAVEQRKESGAANGCVALRAPDLGWDTDDCTHIKDFICEQTRCYYYNYGSIPVSSAQGLRRGKPRYTTTNVPAAVTTQPPSTTSIPVTTTSTPSTTWAASSPTTAAPSTTTTASSSTATTSPEETTNVPFFTETSASTKLESVISSTTEASPSSSTEAGEVATEGTTEESVEVGPETEAEVKVKSRNTVSRSKAAEESDAEEAVPWSWARNIMLEKPVLKKSASL